MSGSAPSVPLKVGQNGTKRECPAKSNIQRQRQEKLRRETRGGGGGGAQSSDNGKKALAMLDAFASVGARLFDVTTTDIKGEKVKFKRNSSLEELLRTIGGRLRKAVQDQRNIIIRPRSTTPTLVQLDDLDGEKVERLSPHAFMVISTSPDNHQVWIAVKDATAHFARRLKKGVGADVTASGATRLAGSLNFKTEYAPGFPRVEVVHLNPGNLTTTAALDEAGFVAPEQRLPSGFAANAGRHRRKAWPDYQRYVQGAPPAHGKGRPDISKADFTWCRTAIEWGWSAAETAKRLMEESVKARENGKRYALRTAARAAESVERHPYR